MIFSKPHGSRNGRHASGPLRSPFGRARGQSRHLDDEPLLSPDRRHGQKKTLVAREPSCFWVYAYPAVLRYAAHSAGGYWGEDFTAGVGDRFVGSRFRTGVHRRNLDEDQYDPPARLGAKGRAARRQGPARQVEDRDFPAALRNDRIDDALPVRRAHQRRALPRRRRAVPRRRR